MESKLKKGNTLLALLLLPFSSAYERTFLDLEQTRKHCPSPITSWLFPLSEIFSFIENENKCKNK
jgi:hypothetical protein